MWDLVIASKAIVNAVSMGSAGKCPFCGEYNQHDFRINNYGTTDEVVLEYTVPHKLDCAAVNAANYLLANGIAIYFPKNFLDESIHVDREED